MEGAPLGNLQTSKVEKETLESTEKKKGPKGKSTKSPTQSPTKLKKEDQVGAKKKNKE